MRRSPVVTFLTYNSSPTDLDCFYNQFLSKNSSDISDLFYKGSYFFYYYQFFFTFFYFYQVVFLISFTKIRINFVTTKFFLLYFFYVNIFSTVKSSSCFCKSVVCCTKPFTFTIVEVEFLLFVVYIFVFFIHNTKIKNIFLIIKFLKNFFLRNYKYVLFLKMFYKDNKKFLVVNHLNIFFIKKKIE